MCQLIPSNESKLRKAATALTEVNVRFNLVIACFSSITRQCYITLHQPHTVYTLIISYLASFHCRIINIQK